MAPFYPHIIPSPTQTATAIFPSNTNALHNHTTPAAPDCDACESPILPDTQPPPPAVTHASTPDCDGCEAPILPDTDGLLPRNATPPSTAGLSQAQVAEAESPSYHSNETGKVLMTVLLVAGIAVALGAVWCAGRACWKYKTRKAAQRRVTSV